MNATEFNTAMLLLGEDGRPILQGEMADLIHRSIRTVRRYSKGQEEVDPAIADLIRMHVAMRSCPRCSSFEP